MNDRLRRTLALLCPLSLFAALPVRAQSGTPFSVQGSILYVGVGGDGFSGVEGGVGVEAQLRYNFVRGFSLGAGYQRSSHGASSGAQFDDVVLSGAFVEPRYVLGTVGSRTAVYGALRIARLTQKTSFSGGSSDVSATQLNAGGGILVAARRNVNLDLGVTFGTVRFGKVTSSAQRELGQGSNAVFRGGLIVGLGR